MEKVVFTNGCFDIIHPGHIELLERARELGTKLIVGINSDESVRQIKGNPRPFNSQDDRAAVLKGLKSVDEVLIFEETTPSKLIEKLKPDVLVKGGDWKINEIIGADFVQSYGGRVESIPLKNGYSTSDLVESIAGKIKNAPDKQVVESSDLTQLLKNSILSHIETADKVLKNHLENIERCAQVIFETFENGKKVLICGNGGSAADAQHIAAEFVGRYETERKALPAIALTTDTSALTAVSNDYGFETIFSRQVEALAAKGDLLIAISTSGNSPNINAATMKARQIGCQTIGLTGAKGKKLASLCDLSILVPAERTARIQEAHILIAHLWCELIDYKIKLQDK